MEIDPNTVAAIMSTELVTVAEDQTLSQVRRLMSEHRVHHVPVVKGRTCIGLLSWTDLIRVNLGDAYKQTQRVTDTLLDVVSIRDAMQEDLRVIRRDASIAEAVELFVDGLYHSLPVVDEDERLVGMLTTTDLLKHLRKLL